MLDSINKDIEDEVSFVLQEFRTCTSKKTTITKTAAALSSKRNRNKTRTSISTSSFKGLFSDLRYRYNDRGKNHVTHEIMVSYLIDKVVSLQFEISISIAKISESSSSSNNNNSGIYKKQYIVRYKADTNKTADATTTTTSDGYDDDDGGAGGDDKHRMMIMMMKSRIQNKIGILEKRVNIICDTMNNNDHQTHRDSDSNYSSSLTSSLPSSASLFAVLSKLLFALDNLQTELLSSSSSSSLSFAGATVQKTKKKTINSNSNTSIINNNNNASIIASQQQQLLHQLTDRERSFYITHLINANKTPTVGLMMEQQQQYKYENNNNTRSTCTSKVDKDDCDDSNTVKYDDTTNNNNDDDYHLSNTVDIALLVLRCALIGKYRKMFVNPVPPITTTVLDINNNNTDADDLVMNTIWIATEYRRRYRHRRQQQTMIQIHKKQKMTQKQQQQQQYLLPLLHPMELELFGFLYSLPWTKRGKVTATLKNYDYYNHHHDTNTNTIITQTLSTASASVQKKNEKNTTNNNNRNHDSATYGSNRMVIEVCLNIDDIHHVIVDNNNTVVTNSSNRNSNCNNDSSYSPRFNRLCRRFGAVTVYHGTTMDRVWSILNTGFCSMSDDPRLCKNGAILGSGVYLSTSKKVATFFATTAASSNSNITNGSGNCSSSNNKQALKHDSLQAILNLVKNQKTKDGNNDDREEENTARATSIIVNIEDQYDISCYPVFEARIARPSNDHCENSENNGNTATSNANTNANNNSIAAAANKTEVEEDSPTRRDGKYYVIPNGCDIRITRLYVTFELTKKKTRRNNCIISFLRKLMFLLPSSIVHYTVIVILISIFIRYSSGSVTV